MNTVKLDSLPWLDEKSPKLALVDEPWMAVSVDVETLEASEEDRELLDQRWEAFRKSPESAVPIEEFKARLAKMRR